MCPFFLYTWQSSLLFVLTGIVMGAVGGGGALLALPVFLLVLHLPMELAVPATAGVVGLAALSGAWDAWRGNRLDLRILGRFALPGMIFAALGAFVAPKIPAPLLHWGFVALLVWSAARLLLQRQNLPVEPETLVVKPLKLAATGAGTGIMMGLFGAGGGFLATSALVLDGGLAVAAAIPVALGTLALNAAASLAVLIPTGTFRWTAVLPAFIAVMLGMELGGMLSRRVHERVLLRILGVLLVVVAVALAWRELGL